MGRKLTPQEAAERFGVDVKTVNRWATAGKIGCTRTLGGHRRYDEDEINALIGGTQDETVREAPRG